MYKRQVYHPIGADDPNATTDKKAQALAEKTNPQQIWADDPRDLEIAALGPVGFEKPKLPYSKPWALEPYFSEA